MSLLMSEYLGSEVIIDLLDGQQVKGVIAAISPTANLLQLTDSSIFIPCLCIYYVIVVGESIFPRLELAADQISNITIVEPTPTHCSATINKNDTRHHALLSNNRTPSKAASTSRQSTPRKMKGGGGGRPNEWSDTDVSQFQEVEFDIQASLHRFDKKKIFSEIREKDRVKPEDRLISHNLSQRKLTPQQRVLEARVETDDFDEIFIGGVRNISISKENHNNGISKDDVQRITAQMLSSLDLTVDQMIEIGAFSLFHFAIDTFGGPNGFQRGIFINIDDGDLNGAIAVSSARHFLNRNIKVYVKINGNGNRQSDIKNAYTICGQLKSLGLEMVNYAPRSYSLALTSHTLQSKPNGASICGLNDTVVDCRWMIRFGIAPSSFRRDIGVVVCDLGWSPKVLSELAGLNIDYFSKGPSYSIIQK